MQKWFEFFNFLIDKNSFYLLEENFYLLNSHIIMLEKF